MAGNGKRFNTGKLRLDLIPAWAEEQIAKVLTAGAEKYGEWNWQDGMAWSNCYAALRRHTSKFWQGEDFDEETGEFHIAHAAVNCIFLLEYYKIYPEGDNRPSAFHRERKVGLDIDGVLANFAPAFLKRADEAGLLKSPVNDYVSWHWDMFYNERTLWGELEKDKEFWATLPVLTPWQSLTFYPHAYITTRRIPTEWTEEWLMSNGFPAAPVHTLGDSTPKIDVIKELGIDMFVDDKFENYLSINKGGVCCFLFSQPHNIKHKVGFRRIQSLSELELWLKY